MFVSIPARSIGLRIAYNMDCQRIVIVDASQLQIFLIVASRTLVESFGPYELPVS